MGDDADLKRFFGLRLRSILVDRGISERQFSKTIGRSPGYLTPILSGKSTPQLTDFARMAKILDMSLDELLGREPSFGIQGVAETSNIMEESAQRIVAELFAVVSARTQRLFTPSLDDVLCWLRETGGVIAPDNPLSIFVDLHYTPDADDNLLKPKHIGAHSLAARQLGAASPDLLTKMMQSLPPADMQEVIYSYRQISERPFELSEQRISVEMPDHGVSFDVDYFRLLHPVKDAQGNSYILNFSTLADGAL